MTTLVGTTFDIARYVDAMYADDIAHLKRICKEECLTEELAKIEKKKRTFEAFYYESLQGFVAALLQEDGDFFPRLSGIPSMKWETRHTIPEVMTGNINKDEKMVARALALRVFMSELRRKNYMVRVSYCAKNDGPHLMLGETIEIRL